MESIKELNNNQIFIIDELSNRIFKKVGKSKISEFTICLNSWCTPYDADGLDDYKIKALN